MSPHSQTAFGWKTSNNIGMHRYLAASQMPGCIADSVPVKSGK